MLFFKRVFQHFLFIIAVLSTIYVTGSVQADTLLPVAIVPTSSVYDYSVAVDSQGFTYIAFHDVNAALAPTGLALLRCNSVDLCDDPSIVPLDSAKNFENVSLSIDSNDIPVVAYYRVEAPEGLTLARCDTSLCNSPTLTTVDGAHAVGKYPSIAFDSSDDPIISYIDAPNALLKVAFCADTTCSSKTISTLGYTTATSFSMDLDSSGKPVGLYSVSPQHLILGRCNDVPSCTNVDTVDLGVRGYGSLLLDQNDHPVVVFLDEDSPNANDRDVKYLRCDDVLCSSKTVQTIEASGNLDMSRRGFGLDSNDIPYISFPEHVTGVSHLRTCSDSSCSAVETLVEFDILHEDLGTATSLTMDGDIPIYIFASQTEGRLYLYNGHNNTPELATNDSIEANTGASVVINNSKLDTSDADNVTPQTLTYTIVDPPAKGSLNLGGSFTQTQIDAGALHYDYSGAIPDQFTFTVSDGFDTIGPFTFAINESRPNAAPILNLFDSTTPTLTWRRVSWATDYEVQISRSRTFKPILHDEILPSGALSFTIPGGLNLADGVYYWRVRARNIQLRWGSWSRGERFTISVP